MFCPQGDLAMLSAVAFVVLGHFCLNVSVMLSHELASPSMFPPDSGRSLWAAILAPLDLCRILCRVFSLSLSLFKI